MLSQKRLPRFDFSHNTVSKGEGNSLIDNFCMLRLAIRANARDFQVMPRNAKTGLHSEEPFQDGKITGRKFQYESALFADQGMPVQGFAGHVSMFAALIVHPMQSADFL
jgi:hypothetical protein